MDEVMEGLGLQDKRDTDKVRGGTEWNWVRSDQLGGREAPTRKGGQLTNSRQTTAMSVAWSTTVRIREE